MNLFYGLIPVAVAASEINRDGLAPVTPDAATVAPDGETCPITPAPSPIDVPAELPPVDAPADTSANPPADVPQVLRAEIGGCVGSLTALGVLTLAAFLARHRLSRNRSTPVGPTPAVLQRPRGDAAISDLVTLHRRLAGEFSRFKDYEVNACGANQLGLIRHLVQSLPDTRLLAAHGQVLILWPKDRERLEPKSHVFLQQPRWEHHVVLAIGDRIYDLDYAGRPATAAVQYRAEMFGDQPCLYTSFTLAGFLEDYNAIMGSLDSWHRAARDYVPTAVRMDDDLSCNGETFVRRSERVAALRIDATRGILQSDGPWHGFLQTIASAVASVPWTAEKTFYLKMRIIDGSLADLPAGRLQELMNLFATLKQRHGVKRIVLSLSDRQTERRRSI